MIGIRAEQCTGCGACLEVCPTAALYLVEGKATLDRALCRECEACLAACPTGAITVAAQDEAVADEARVPALRPEPEVIQIRTAPRPAPLRARVLPLVGSALLWAERDLLPWLADVLDRREQRTTHLSTRTGASSREILKSQARGGQGQRRRRRRGSG